MIGFAGDEDTMEWSTFEGVALEDHSIQVTLDPETVMNVEDNNALLAIVSK